MRYEKKSSWAKHFDFILLDLICAEIVIFLCYAFRNGLEGTIVSKNYGRLALLVGVLFICIVFFNEPYSGILRRGYLKELWAVLSFNAILLAAVFTFLFAMKMSADYSRIMLFTFFIINSVMTWFLHVMWKREIRKRTYHDGKLNRMLLITKREYVHQCVDRLMKNPYGSMRLVGIVLMENGERETEEDSIEGVPIVAKWSDYIEYCKSNVIDDVLFYLENEKLSDEIEELVDMGIVVHVNLVQLKENYLAYRVETINGIMTLTTGINNVTQWQLALKRLMDICGGIVGIILTGVIALIITPVIKVQSPGPIFFTQTRVGRNGRQFKIYKFRSMYMDAEQRKKELMASNKMNGLMFKMDNDPRIYPFGHFIRKTSLDEFPQFLNVLKGEMSLVGTRPPTLDEYKQYEPHHKSRLAMKPGVTGLWQVSGRSDITDFEEVVRLDNEYIRNWSLSLDIKILFRTLLVVVGKKGSV